MLARHEQALQLSVLDHLREIEARRLYLRRGYSSLFDYTVRELRYTEAAAWRRIKAMRLCRETRGVRERLQDGSLNLSNAALLQNSFERWDRGGGGPLAAGSAGAARGAAGSGAAGTSAAPGAGSVPAATAGKAAGAPAPVLDAHARQELVERAMGKSTRQVQQMLAEVDPEAAAPAERLRPLGDGRWELKAVVDAECQRGLQQLRELLSHVDPHLTVGQLVGRLVREGVERYDPSRPPRRKRRKSDPASDRCSAETAARETTDRVAAAAAAENPRRAEKAAAATTSLSAPKRSAKPTAGGTSPADLASRQEALGKLRPRDNSGRRRAALLRRRSCVAPPADRGSERQRRGADRADFGAEARRGGRRFDFSSELRRSWTAQADIDAEASRGYWWLAGGSQRRRRGIGGADFASEVPCRVRQIDSGCGTTRGVATRSGLLQLRRPAYRAALWLTLLPGAGPHRSGRAGRCCGGEEPPPTLLGSSPLPAPSPAALRAAGPGDVSKNGSGGDRLSARHIPGRRAAGAEC